MRSAQSSPVSSARIALEARWLHLTHTVLPSLATARGWPVRNDHCLQRILLDAACGGRWLDHVQGRPAYKAIDEAKLTAAIALAEAVEAGKSDLHKLNRRSLEWRGKLQTRRPGAGRDLSGAESPAAEQP